MVQWVTPVIKLAELKENWSMFREKLRQPSRKRFMQMEAFLFFETS